MNRAVPASLAVGLVALTGCSATAGPRLAVTSDPTGHCWNAPSAEAWAGHVTDPTEFALDYLQVRGSEPVTVDSVQLIGGNHRLRLVDVAFVPGGGVGDGFRFADGATAAAVPGTWARRTGLPGARLTPLHPTKAELAGDPSADRWQIVVGVVPEADDASAGAVQITYRVHGHHHVVTGQDFVELSRQPTECSGPPSG